MVWYIVAFIVVILLFVVLSALQTPTLRSLTIVDSEEIRAIANGPKPAGTKRALLCGCNYPGTSYELSGCVNDVRNISDLLTSRGFTVELLCDDGSTPLQPTSANIIAKMTAGVTSLQAGDTFFVWYSGHGAQLRNTKADGGYDECWCPPDTVPTGKYLRDDVLNSIVKKGVAGSTIFVGSDSCHSGTVFDLSYILQETNRLNNNRTLELANTAKGRKKLPSKLTQANTARFNVSESAKAKSAARAAARAVTLPPKLPKMVTVADPKFPVLTPRVVTISGCQDFSTSADTYESGENQGAMTWAFLAVFSANLPLSSLLGGMRYVLKKSGYTQIPQLGFGSLLNADTTPLSSLF
jgi:hypothetical protein